MKIADDLIYKSYKHGDSIESIMILYKVDKKKIRKALLAIGGRNFNLPLELKVIEKTFTYYDHRHGYVYNVQAANRRAAFKLLEQNLIGKIWDDKDGLAGNVFEVDKVINIS